MEENLLSRIEKLEERMIQLEKRVRKKMKERELTLEDKFAIHDHAQRLLRWFETMTKITKNSEYKDLSEIVKQLVSLVDNALSIKFP